MPNLMTAHVMRNIFGLSKSAAQTKLRANLPSSVHDDNDDDGFDRVFELLMQHIIYVDIISTKSAN